MVFADVARAVILLAVPVANWSGDLKVPLLYVVILLTGMLNILFDVAGRSFLPSVVPIHRLAEANSKLSAGNSAAEFLGFAAAAAYNYVICESLARQADA